MSKVYYCTPEGYQDLVTLQNTVKEKINEVAEVIGEVTSGVGQDLGENSEYLQAKEELDRLESKYSEIGNKIQKANIIDVKTVPKNGKVVFGATVELLDVDNERNVKYKIVGIDESDIKKGKISLESPLARAIMGNQVGDEIDVDTPTGDVLYEIMNIEYI